jgi:hypothetical protein
MTPRQWRTLQINSGSWPLLVSRSGVRGLAVLWKIMPPGARLGDASRGLPAPRPRLARPGGGAAMGGLRRVRLVQPPKKEEQRGQLETPGSDPAPHGERTDAAIGSPDAP